MKIAIVDYNLDIEYYRELLPVVSDVLTEAEILYVNVAFGNVHTKKDLAAIEKINSFLERFEVHLSDNILIDKFNADKISKAIRYLVVIKQKSKSVVDSKKYLRMFFKKGDNK